jgi:hypothetical protein
MGKIQGSFGIEDKKGGLGFQTWVRILGCYNLAGVLSEIWFSFISEIWHAR